MRTVRIQQYGGPEVLEFAQAEDPVASPGHVVVEVAAAGVNFVDTHMREGRSLYPTPLPTVLGLEGAGVVSEVGEGADLRIGDRIAWSSVLGSYAERVAVPAAKAVPVPDEIDLEIAAAVILQGITAHYLAFDTFPIVAGSKALIHAGASGVEALLIQILKKAGAEIFTTASTPEKEAIASAAGADHVINYSQEDFAAAIKAIAGDRPLDVVFDSVGAPTLEPSLGLLRKRGALVSFGHSGGAAEPVAPATLANHGSVWLTRTTSRDFVSTPKELRTRTDAIFGWLREGGLQVRIGTRNPLEKAADAHRELEARRALGKALLIP